MSGEGEGGWEGVGGCGEMTWIYRAEFKIIELQKRDIIQEIILVLINLIILISLLCSEVWCFSHKYS